MTYDTGIDANLMRTFKFDLDDLRANRRGDLTDRQRERLVEYRQRIIRTNRIMIPGCAVLLLAGLVVYLLGGRYDSALLVALAAPFALLIALSYYGLSIVTTRSMLHPTLKTTEGAAFLRTTANRSGKAYQVRLGRRGQAFFVTRPQYQAFVQGQAYRIYHTAGTPSLILAVEKC